MESQVNSTSCDLSSPNASLDRQSCKRCGRPIKGRRRNGFCSDGCRMAVRREVIAARQRKVLDRLKEAVDAVEDEFGSKSDGTGS